MPDRTVISIVLNNFTNDSRVLKEGITLQNSGYDVKIIALHDLSLDEHCFIQGIPVHRIKLKSKNWAKNSLVSSLKYSEFFFQIIKRYRNIEVVHCNDLNTLPIGVCIKLFSSQKTKIIYDAHEYETEIDKLSGIRKKFSKILEKILIRHADGIITVSNSIANEYKRLYNIPKPELVLNTPPYIEIGKFDLFRKYFNLQKEQTIFLYQGGLSSSRGIEILLETFKLLDKKSIIVFMGYGPLEKTIKIAANSYENIFFHEAVEPNALLKYTSSADFGILFYENTCLNHYYCSPNKIFEYLMAEIPVITSNLFEIKNLVNDNHIGTVATDNTPLGLKNAIERALLLDKKKLKKNLLEAKKTYNWEEQEKVLLALYKSILKDI